MPKIHDRMALLVDLMKHIIPEQLDNVPITRFRPSDFMIEPNKSRVSYVKQVMRRSHALWTFIDESEFTHQPNKSRVFQFSKEHVL